MESPLNSQCDSATQHLHGVCGFRSKLGAIALFCFVFKLVQLEVVALKQDNRNP